VRACSREGFTADHVTMQSCRHTFICSRHFVRGKGPTTDPIPGNFCRLTLRCVQYWKDLICCFALTSIPVNFVTAHEDTVWYSARSPRLPIVGGACCPSSRTSARITGGPWGPGTLVLEGPP